MNPAYISAFAALAGALIGGLTSFATSWLTQRTQLLSAQREAEKAKLEALYTDFIAEAARLFGEALKPARSAGLFLDEHRGRRQELSRSLQPSGPVVSTGDRGKPKLSASIFPVGRRPLAAWSI